MNTVRSFNLNLCGQVTPIAVEVAEYTNGGTYVQLIDMTDGVLYATLSVWFPESRNLASGQFYVKHWGQEDLVQALEAQGVIQKLSGIKPVKSGFVTAHAYTLPGNPINN